MRLPSNRFSIRPAGHKLGSLISRSTNTEHARSAAHRFSYLYGLTFLPVTTTFAQLNELDAVAQALINEAANQHVWLFEGDMGVGKTTLIKALCRAVGVVSVVQSPTYGLVNEYSTKTGESVYHFDCYRLRNEAEAMDIGLEEYLDSGAYCFVEWPERIESLWPTHYYHVSLSADQAGIRMVTTQLK